MRYPAISCDPDHFDDVHGLVRRIRDDLETLGLARARVLDVDGALPCVASAGDNLRLPTK